MFSLVLKGVFNRRPPQGAGGRVRSALTVRSSIEHDIEKPKPRVMVRVRIRFDETISE